MLTAHDDAEHGALYLLKLDLLGGGDVFDRSLAAHRGQAADRPPEGAGGPPLVESFAVLRQLVADHVQDEEANLSGADRPGLHRRARHAGRPHPPAKQRGG